MYYVVEEAASLVSGILQRKKNGLVFHQWVDIMLAYMKNMCYRRETSDKMSD